ncbi:MAG TPA: hypothetical protein PK675_01460 [Clostridia bacterium]|nr:hypothetical protein [Clostridia bacterium]
MNLIWTILILASLLLSLLDPTAVLANITSAVGEALNLALSLVAVYCIWLTVFEILKRLNVLNKIAKFISPLIDLVYGKVNDAAKEYIALNISANLIGVGSAATPAAIKAVENMKDGSIKATPSIIMLFVINATSLQLLPTTVMSMRASLGSVSPADIALPTLIVSVTTTLIGILLVKLFTKKCQTISLPLS